MKKVLFILIILFFIKNNITINAQDKYFEKQYAWDIIHNGFSILPNNQNNYIISGQARDNDLYSWYSYSIEIDKYGNDFPVNRYLDLEPNYDAGMKEMIKTEYGFFLGGWGHSPDIEDDGRTYYVMISEQGGYIKSDTLGTTTYAHYNYTCCRTSDNGYFLAGEIVTSNGSSNIHPYLIKLNAAGEQEWDSIYYNYPGRANFNDIIPAADNSRYYILGTKNFIVTGTQGDIILLKIDDNGETIWEKTYDFELQESVGKFKLKRDGGFIIYGNRSMDGGVSPFMFAVDSLGDVTKIANDNHFQHYTSLVELPDSSLVFSGFAYSDAGTADNNMQLLKLDKDFNFMWRRQYGGEGNDYGYDIIKALDGGFIISGRTESNTNGADLYVVKTNCMGLLTEPQAAFDYEAAGGVADFINESQYVYPDSIDGGHFLWHFGDERTSNEVSPSHEYAVNGHYTVTLTAIVCNDTSIYTQDILVDGVGISENNNLLADKITLFPNPASDFLQIKTDVFPKKEAVRMSIFNVLGEKVLEQDFSNEIDISALSEGAYFLQFQNAEQSIVKRFVINR